MSDSVVLKPENATEAAQEENNPYAYLERDFSSENYKIEVKNLPKYYGFSVSLFRCKIKVAFWLLFY